MSIMPNKQSKLSILKNKSSNACVKCFRKKFSFAIKKKRIPMTMSMTFSRLIYKTAIVFYSFRITLIRQIKNASLLLAYSVEIKELLT